MYLLDNVTISQFGNITPPWQHHMTILYLSSNINNSVNQWLHPNNLLIKVIKKSRKTIAIVDSSNFFVKTRCTTYFFWRKYPLTSYKCSTILLMIVLSLLGMLEICSAICHQGHHFACANHNCYQVSFIQLYIYDAITIPY